MALRKMSSAAFDVLRRGVKGVWPTMITPFKADSSKSIDYDMVEKLTEWYIKSGSAGLFSVCLSSEFYQLTNEERLQLAERVHNKAAGRVPVVASGTFGGPIEDQAAFVREMAKRVDAVVIVVNRLAEKEESNDTWLENAKKLLDLTDDVPMGFYESPEPYSRVLTPDMLSWAVSTGRFYFHKDGSTDRQLVTDKINAATQAASKLDHNFGFYTAKAHYIKHVLDHGGYGFSGISANFYPWVHAWLCNNYENKHADKVQHFLGVADNVIRQKYPRSAKMYLSEYYGLPITSECRIHDMNPIEEEVIKMKFAFEMMDEMCRSMNIKMVNPRTLEEA
ncbi:4-hydroxy-tetrahydrodipicolinate synthase-like [Corticium candelabrum]|uniref:4-hydroxy-tetrahydrodipicolinate synthase-like n=1 Tax=Corticium candelabrum TaxID=121492 RepID=UPI002E271FFE|nr:4-hydroxy-tetrahydrodipicolinate synthase-like [Corticium candelabrum]